jgi:hypothetical protein
VHSQNAYLGRYCDIWTRSNGANGFQLSGFHTALHVDRVESSGNTLAGYNINGVIYSTFTSCGSDTNGTQGYAMSNMQGVTFVSCGTESNGRDGWQFYTSNASAAGLVAQQTDIRGVVMVGCYGLDNSLSVPGGYATFVGCATADSRNIELTIKGGVAHPKTATDVALYLQGSSGQVTIHKEGFDDAAFIAADIKTGTYAVQNLSMVGKRCMLNNTGAQSIPTGTDTPISTWNTTPVYNDLNATVSGTAITIPRGVNKVRVSAQIAWATVAGGTSRTIKLQKNGGGFNGQAQVAQAPLGINIEGVTTGIVSVVAGDTFQVNAFQDQGAAVALRTGPDSNVWFIVEAVC